MIRNAVFCVYLLFFSTSSFAIKYDVEVLEYYPSYPGSLYTFYNETYPDMGIDMYKIFPWHWDTECKKRIERFLKNNRFRRGQKLALPECPAAHAMYGKKGIDLWNMEAWEDHQKIKNGIDPGYLWIAPLKGTNKELAVITPRLIRPDYNRNKKVLYQMPKSKILWFNGVLPMYKFLAKEYSHLPYSDHSLIVHNWENICVKVIENIVEKNRKKFLNGHTIAMPYCFDIMHEKQGWFQEGMIESEKVMASLDEMYEAFDRSVDLLGHGEDDKGALGKAVKWLIKTAWPVFVAEVVEHFFREGEEWKRERKREREAEERVERERREREGRAAREERERRDRRERRERERLDRIVDDLGPGRGPHIMPGNGLDSGVGSMC